MKIMELFKSLIETQKQINETLKELHESTQTTCTDFRTTTIRVNNLQDIIETNIYSKEQTIETINKEYDYRKMYEDCEKVNRDLLKLIEIYFKFNNKYEVIDLFNKITAEYDVKLKEK